MANNYKQQALKRLETFREECQDRNVPSLNNTDNIRIKTFFINDLSSKYGADITNVSFDDLLSDLMGAGIKAIEQYIQSLSNEFPFLDEEPSEEPQADIPSEGSAPPPANEEGSDESETESPSEENQRREKAGRPRKRASSSGNDIFWTPASSSVGNSRKVKELKLKINTIAKDRDILHRQFSIYRQDYAIVQGILEYGKKGSSSLEYNGLSLDNHQNVLHAALELLVRNLESSGNTQCFLNIKKYRDMAEEEVALMNEKIAKLEKEIQKLTRQ